MRSPGPFVCLGLLYLVCLAGHVQAGEPCQSGLLPGQRPGPYSAVISTGPNRGKSHCYICETAERPAILLFARAPSDTLGKLAQKIDKALEDNKKAELRGWVTFLSDDQLSLDPKLVEWSKRHSLRDLPLGVFEDTVGPPSYRLARDAEVTVLLFVKQKVVANFAFRAGELTDEKAAEVLKALPKVLSEKK
jgi:hypothetical protein